MQYPIRNNLKLEFLEPRVLLSVNDPLVDIELSGTSSLDESVMGDEVMALTDAQSQSQGIIFRELTTNTITVPEGQNIGQAALRALLQNVSTKSFTPTIKYYLSTDQVFDETDTIYECYTSYVYSGVYFYIKPNGKLELPGQGTYYIKIRAEDNWSDLITLNVVAQDAKPQIEITNVQISKTNFQQYEPYKVTMTITNTGAADYMQDVIGSTEEELYWNADPAFRQWLYIFEPPSGDSWWNGGSFELDHNSSYIRDYDYIPVGQTVVGIHVNSFFGTSESLAIKYLSDYYSNVADPQNDSFSQTINVTISGDYGWDRDFDVIVHLSLLGDTEVAPGERIPFEITVTNTGDMYTYATSRGWPTGQFVSLVQSEDEIIELRNPVDTNIISNYLDWYHAPTLMPGEDYTFTGEIVAPGEAGTYYLAAIADSGDKLTESNEDNNLSNLLTLTVTSAKPQADVVYPIVGELLDPQEMDDPNTHYIELEYSNTEEDSIDGDEITLAGIGAEDLQIGSITKVEDGRYRYEVIGDYGTGPIEVQIKAETFTNDAQEPNEAETVSFLALPDLEPFVLTYDKNKLNWDGAKQQFSYSGEASLGMKNGSTVDPLITINGAFNYDTF